MYLSVSMLPNYKENSSKNFIWAPKLSEAKSYLRVIEFFFLIGQVQYKGLALVVPVLDSAVQQNDKSLYSG